MTSLSPAKRITSLIEQCRDDLAASRESLDRAQQTLDDLLRLANDAGGAFPTGDIAELLRADRQALLAQIVAAVRNEPAPPQVVSGLVLDTQQRIVRVGRRAVDLTETEFDILQFLWERQPAVASRRALLDHLYKGKNEPSERTMDVFISHIRQKLKALSGGFEFIESVRGQGWILAARPQSLRKAA